MKRHKYGDVNVYMKLLDRLFRAAEGKSGPCCVLLGLLWQRWGHRVGLWGCGN